MAFYLEGTEAPKGEGLGFFRRGKECSEKIQIADSNIDLSSKGNHYSSLFPFVETISRYEKILTHRLHVAIAAILLRREVHLISNSYLKIQAIYESSIKDNFDNVYFHGTEQIDKVLKNF